MASVTDIGGLGDPGDNPLIGGPVGWAAAVRDVLDSSNTPVNTRIAAAVAGLEQEAHGSEHSAAGGDPVSISPSQVVGTAIVEADSRLTNPRTPTAHASSHAAGGGDPVSLTQAQVTNLTADLAAKASTSHAISHGSGGGDQVTLAQGQITGLVAALAALSPIASPVFTGNPTAPTPAAGDNDTSIATTAFVRAQGNVVRITRPNTDDRLVEVWNGSAWSVVDYDSGVRRVAATGGWTGDIFLRRLSSTVYYWCDSAVVMPATGTDIFTLPTGFTRPSGGFQLGSARNQSTGATGVVLVDSVNAIAWYGGLSVGQNLAFSGSLTTETPTPGSLPGTLQTAAPA